MEAGKRLKLSESFAEDLRICDNALEDAQRLLQKILKKKSGNDNKTTYKLHTPRLCQTESSDGSNTPSLSMSPLPKPPSGVNCPVLERSPVSLTMPPTPAPSSNTTSLSLSPLSKPPSGVKCPVLERSPVSLPMPLTPSGITPSVSLKHAPTSGHIPHLTSTSKQDEEALENVCDDGNGVLCSPSASTASPMHVPMSPAQISHQEDSIEHDDEVYLLVSPSPKHKPISAGHIQNLTEEFDIDHEETYPVATASPMHTPTSVRCMLPQTGVMEDSAEMHVMAYTSSPKHTPIAAGHIAPLTNKLTHDNEMHVVSDISLNHAPTSAGHLSDPTDTMEHDAGVLECVMASSDVPCLESFVAEASSTFLSFLKRLTEHGVVINATSAPGGVKEFLVTKSLANCSVDKNISMSNVVTDEVREDTQRDGAAEYQMPAQEKGVSGADCHFISPQSTQEPNCELEKKESCGGDEPPNLEPAKLLDNDEASPNSPLFSTHVFESEEDDDPDGFKELWDDMELSLACMNEAKRSKVLPASNEDNGCCDHNFYKTDDMGMVCSKCGLVGQDPEYIFNYIWGEASNRRRHGNPAVVVQANTVVVVEDVACQDETMLQQPVSQPLVLHPAYKDKLHQHQHDGFQFLQRNLMQEEPSGCILAHAPGTGKTFLIIAFLQSFLTAFPEERPLIVAPKGMLSVWAREFAKWQVDNIAIFNLHQFLGLQEEDHVDSRGRRKVKQDSQLQMVKQWKAQKSVLLVGYSTFSRLAGEDGTKSSPELRKLLLEAPGLLVLDEGHCPRNKRTQILIALSQVRTRRRILLSGTLFQNNFDELFNLYHLVRPEFMASNASCTKSLLEGVIRTSSSPAKTRLAPSPKAKQRPEREHTEWALFQNLGETIRAGDREQKRHAVSQLRQLSEPFVDWYKGQVLETLPGLIDLTVMLKLTAKQEQALLSLHTKAENALDRSIQSTKVCVHPTLLRFDPDAGHMMETPWKETDLDPRESSKIMFILDLLQLSVPMNEKVVLFSQFLGPFILLEKILARTHGWRLKKQILKIEGKTTLEEREFIIDRFNQDPKARILLASIKTCGEGVSLIGASRVVLLDVHFNPAVSRQAVSRAFRIGQKKKVFVYRLVGAGAIEEDAHLKACEKEWMAKQIFEGSSDEDYAAYCHDVDPQEVDPYFESQYLRENVVKCVRYHFV